MQYDSLAKDIVMGALINVEELDAHEGAMPTVSPPALESLGELLGSRCEG